MYKQDLVVNNLQWWICHKPQPNQIIPNVILNNFFPYISDQSPDKMLRIKK